MSIRTHETAPTQYVITSDINFAYRRFGPRGKTPLLLLNYFAANMDDWDPALSNGLARDRDVIMFDYAGISGSTGEAPYSVPEMAKQCLRFCRSLNVNELDLLGFSLGGMIAQHLAHDYPDMVRRVILLGTGPRGGEGMSFTELSVNELADPVALLLKAFFTPSEVSQNAGQDYLQRLQLRTVDRDLPVSATAAEAQLYAIRDWGTVPPTNRFATLSEIHQPTLIVHGNNDIVVIPINAFLLEQHLPNAQLLMYPDSNHGAASQHIGNFLGNVRLFFQD